MSENGLDYKRKCVIHMLTVLCISCRPNLLLILNKQISTDCFILIYNPLVCLSCVESVKVKKKKKNLLISDFMNVGSNLPVLKVLPVTSCDDILIGVCLNDVLGQFGGRFKDFSCISFTIIIVIIIIQQVGCTSLNKRST